MDQHALATPTDLIYLRDFTILHNTAHVADCYEDSGRMIVVLDRTIFYPQGGGQPFDQGTIASVDGTFRVEEVRFIDGLVRHIGTFASGSFEKGASVTCSVDRERRHLNSRLHSAGHVVDMAVVALRLSWTPGKGYHFPQGPYVEYHGTLDAANREALARDIETKCREFIAEDRETRLEFMSAEEMRKACHFVPDNLPAGKPGRVVFYGDFGVPCGGTHVAHLAEIGDITIRKVRPEGEHVKVAYDVPRG